MKLDGPKYMPLSLVDNRKKSSNKPFSSCGVPSRASTGSSRIPPELLKVLGPAGDVSALS